MAGTRTRKPNVIYIVLDDMGFAHLGCYGSTIHTPNIDRLAADGLRYNNFHTTAICSATRASLLTGANHHEAGICSVVDYSTGKDNNLGYIRPEYATVAEILKEYGYATFCNGKWHLTKDNSPAGDKTNWPLQKGFDQFYGFMEGQMDQYHPHLIRDNSEAEQPKTSEEGYHFSEDVVSDAIHKIYQQHMARPEQPFFLYLAFGAMHNPHHAPQEYIDRYAGQFDMGWDKIREIWFERQKQLGVIPQDAELTDRNLLVDAWDDLTEDEKRLYARYMEVYAGMLEHTDEQIGRLIDYLEKSGQLEDTVIVLLSDNGASSEGGKNGKYNEYLMNGIAAKDEAEIPFALEHIDQIGGEYANNHYPTGWANAGNTPFQWYKIWAHEGGIKDPLIIHYPRVIQEKGAICKQYHHVSDITPTILDLIGEDKPACIKGVWQKPFSGISMKYTLENPEAKDQKHVQHYEVWGNRSIYKDGWKAVVNHMDRPYEDDVWELYHVETDYSEKYDVADQYPEKLRELQDAFLVEAAKYDVLPLVNRFAETSNTSLNETVYDYKYIIEPFELNITGPSSVWIDNRDNEVIVNLNRKNEDVEGVLFCSGDRFSGFSFYIQDNYLKYSYNYGQRVYTDIVSNKKLPLGEIVVGYSFQTKGKGAHVSLYINGEIVGEGDIPALYFLRGPAITIKANKYTAVTDNYKVPFEYQDTIDRLVIHNPEGDVSKELTLAKFMKTE